MRALLAPDLTAFVTNAEGGADRSMAATITSRGSRDGRYAKPAESDAFWAAPSDGSD